MKKILGLFAIAMLMVTTFTSCDKNDDGDDNAKSYLLKSVSDADWAGGTEKWEFTWDANKKVTGFDNYWDNAIDKEVTYDYTTAGKLKLIKDAEVWREYDINAQGYITKDYTDGHTFEYNADGYLTTFNEYWGGAIDNIYKMEITNGNITKITKYADDGVTVKRIKEFFYTVGKNLNNLHQANATDSEWKPVGNFYGKPSKNLVDYFEYWDPRVTPITKSRSTMAYTFNTLNNPIKVVKTLTDMSTEEWNYTYYEE